MAWLRALPRGLAGVGAAASAVGLTAGLSSSYPTLGAAAHAEEEKSTALDPNEWKTFKLLEKKTVASNDATGIRTEHLRFTLDDKHQKLGLPVAACFITRAPIGDENEKGEKKAVIRPYTPVTTPEEPDPVGYFDLVIKRYPSGKMSKYIADLEPGYALDVKGPIPKFEYKPNMKKRIGMIAGGSGITPMLQVASKVLSNKDDKTEVSLICANQSEDDIILKDELDKIAKDHPNFRVHFLLDQPKDADRWKSKGSKGYVTKELVEEHLFPGDDDTWILVCGPPPMMKALSGEKKSPKDQGELSGLLATMGYTKDQVYKF